MPHFQKHYCDMFITFRLVGSIPKEIMSSLKKQKSLSFKEYRYVPQKKKNVFEIYNMALDSASAGPDWLKTPTVANIVSKSILHRHPDIYTLIAFCIMPTHVHLVIQLNTDEPLNRILQSLKRITAKNANNLLKRTGQFCHLPQQWEKLPYSYLNPEFNFLLEEQQEY